MSMLKKHIIFQSLSNYKFLILPYRKQAFIFAFVSTTDITDFLHCPIIFVCVLVVLLVDSAKKKISLFNASITLVCASMGMASLVNIVKQVTSSNASVTFVCYLMGKTVTWLLTSSNAPITHVHVLIKILKCKMLYNVFMTLLLISFD